MDPNKKQPNDLQVDRNYEEIQYEKLGNAGIKGISFQLDVLTVLLLKVLNATEIYPTWRLSTENKKAGKFDDIVFESSNGDTLVQCKYRQKKETKITQEDLFSTNSKNCDFSLLRYFFEYHDIKSKFVIKNVVLCTNAKLQLDEITKNMINVENLTTDNLLNFDGPDKICYTFNNSIVTKLKASTKMYYEKNLKKRENISENVISTENILEFLEHFQLIANYPSEKQLETIIENILSQLHNAQNLDYKICSKYVREKMEVWFKEKEGKYLRHRHAKAIFCELTSNSYCDKLKEYNISFEQDPLCVISRNQKGVLHIIPQEDSALTEIKVFQALQKEKVNKMLFLNLDKTNNMIENFMESFKIQSYTILVITSFETVQENVAQEICDNILETLNEYKYKRIILISREDNILAKKINTVRISIYEALKDQIVFTDLTKETREELRQEKCVIFQGKDMSLTDLRLTDESLDEILAPDMLLKIIKGEKIKVGSSLLDEHLCNHYVPRKFVRGGHSFPEEEMYNLENSCEEKIILISDSPGMGKSTVLTNLLVPIKNTHPYLWVVKVDLKRYTKVLWEYQRKNVTHFDTMDLLNSEVMTKFINSFQKKLFLMDERVVLMVDGVDEIVPNYTDIVFSFLKDCSTKRNLKKIFITTRPHLRDKLEEDLNGVSLSLEPFSEPDQVIFLKRYWCNELNLQGKPEKKIKCEMYANALITAAARWINKNSVNTFCGIPLQTRMLAEVFQERKGYSNGDMKDWQGCIEFVNSTNVIPKLPEKINLAELYQMFIDKKRGVFIWDKCNPSRNIVAEEGVTKIFDECYNDHCILALETVLSEKLLKRTRKLFRFYKQARSKNTDEGNLLKLGIVQKENGQLFFIHKTFAEYFVAELLLAELQCNFQRNFQNFLIEDIFCDIDLDVVRSFLDNMLQKQPPFLRKNTIKAWGLIKYMRKLVTPRCYLHVVSEEGHVNILRLIKSLNVTMDVNIKLQVGSTALHYAAGNGQLDVIKLLVEEKADVDMEDLMGYKAIHYAAQGDHLNVVKFLMEKSAVGNEVDYKLIHMAIYGDAINVIRFLVESGTNVNDTPGGLLALHEAASRGRLLTVKYLVESGIDVNIRDYAGNTALCFAARTGQVEAMKFLIEKGADVNIKNKHGESALCFAVYRRSLHAMKYLIENGADIDVGNKINTLITSLYVYLQEKNGGRFQDVHWFNSNFLSADEILANLKFLIDNGAEEKKYINGTSFFEVSKRHYSGRY